jgi:hypothetical protein
MTLVRRAAFLLFAIATFAAAPSAVLADARNNVHVLITPTSDGVVARFTLEHPVEAFVLGYASGEVDDIREKSWKLSSADLTRTGSTIAHADGEAFSSFEVEIAPSNEPTDATYPCLFSVGENGYGLYAGYFVADEAQFATTLEVRATDDQVVLGLPLDRSTWRVDPAFHKNVGHRYVYVGPRDNVVKGDHATFVVPPGMAHELIERVRTNVEESVTFFTHKTGRPLAAKPLVIVAPNLDYGQPGMQGDTTVGPAVALRLFGKPWRNFDPASDRLDHGVAHEIAHFWNSSGTYRAAKGSPAWLWEGGSEIWALAARTAVMKRLSTDGARQHVEKALNNCISSLFDQPLAGPRSGVTYACGETLYWIADAAEKRQSRGRGDIFSVWRRIFDEADYNGGVYTIEDVLTAAVRSNDAKDVYSLFLSQSGTERWHTLPVVLGRFGIELTPVPMTDFALRRAMIWHFLNMTCSGSRGMLPKTDHVVLDTGNQCGPLSGDPEVDALNGHDLFTELPAAYAAARAACADGDTIVFTRQGRPEERSFPCTIPLPAAPSHFRIVRTP